MNNKADPSIRRSREYGEYQAMLSHFCASESRSIVWDSADSASVQNSRLAVDPRIGVERLDGKTYPSVNKDGRKLRYSPIGIFQTRENLGMALAAE
jgi:hypothetical protein